MWLAKDPHALTFFWVFNEENSTDYEVCIKNFIVLFASFLFELFTDIVVHMHVSGMKMNICGQNNILGGRNHVFIGGHYLPGGQNNLMGGQCASFTYWVGKIV